MNQDLLKDLELIKEFQLESIKGGTEEASSAASCAACCQYGLGGGTANHDADK